MRGGRRERGERERRGKGEENAHFIYTNVSGQIRDVAVWKYHFFLFNSIFKEVFFWFFSTGFCLGRYLGKLGNLFSGLLRGRKGGKTRTFGLFKRIIYTWVYNRRSFV